MTVSPVATGVYRLRAAIVCAVVAQIACIGVGDAFILSEKKLVHGYRLERFEGFYYVVAAEPADTSSPTMPGGILQGAVERLGWNETHIVAAVEKGGWRIVDARTGSVSKALSSDEVAIELATNPELKSITIYDVAEAWRRLSYW